MTSKETNGHQKHAKLTRPDIGYFNRNEWAILGTPCDNIKRLSFALTGILSKHLRVAYVDADHKSADEEMEKGKDQNSVLAYGGTMEFTDKITFNRFEQVGEMNHFQNRAYFDNIDLVLVNGNHFQAKKQIVVVDPKKSLEKKLDRLNDVGLILMSEKDLAVPEYLQSAINDFRNIPVMSLEQVDQISDFLKKRWEDNIPPLRGLVLAGGQSTRMGHDKGKINYHGKDQRIYMWELLNACCDQSFISIREDQENELQDYPVITDSFTGLGPYGAILSAFKKDPNAAWLVVACDQPYIDNEILTHLINHRNLSKTATCFYNPETQFPEPLITIWEPRAYPVLLNFLSQGYSCPRKALINSDCEVLQAPQPAVLKNVNTPEEYEQVGANPD